MADAVQRVFGGVRLIIPAPERLTKNSLLSRAFGLSVALKISEAVCCNGQGVTCIPPLGEESHPVKLSDEIRNRLRGGMPTRTVAKDLGIHERTVWRERAKLKNEERPDVLLMLKRGRAVDDVAQYTILSAVEIKEMRADLIASGELASTDRAGTSKLLKPKGH